MAYNVYVCKVKNIRPANNADRLNLCEVFGNTTVIDKSVNEQDLYLYFPCDGQISQEFGEVNNLFRKKDINGNDIGGFIDPVKRNIRTISLRGNKSDGLVLPLSSLDSFGDTKSLKEGDIVSVFNGHEIARKYIPVVKTISGNRSQGNRTRKNKILIAPLFAEHADTEQLAYNLNDFKPNDEIEITLKMHGTSQRTGYLPVFKGYKDSCFHKVRNFLCHLINKMCDQEIYEDIHSKRKIYDWDYISGTRRTVLNDFDGGFYGSNSFRQKHHDSFVGKLMKGETVYYEVVGFTDNGTPIMGSCSNNRLGKDFKKIYGKETVFSYGCELGESDFYVYRMTMTNEDGFVVEYSPDFMRYRCEQMGVKYVPVFARVILPDIEYFDKEHIAGSYAKEMAEQYYDGVDPIGKTHIREGVVVRILNRPKFTAYKHKNYNFKVLSGLIKEGLETSSEINHMTADEISEL